MKIAIYYDTLVSKGGAERVAIELANRLDADIITAGFDPELKKWIPIKKRVIDLKNTTLSLFSPIGTLFEAPLRFYFSRNRFHYDIHIFLGFSSIYASLPVKQNVWLCFSPNRMLYDLKDVKQTYANPLARLIFAIYARLFTSWDQHIARNNFKIIVGQNSIIQKRIKKYYQKDSRITHSPVDTSQFYFKEFGDFFLCISRLFYEKRVDLIAQAFTKMPDKKLIIVGNGPEENKIKNIIADHKNITLLQSCDDKKLAQLYATCLATVYMPLNEDFGLSPIEGMASGKACIGADEGGLKESIINGKTGYRIQATEEAIMKTIGSYSQVDANRMKQFCIEHAKQYDINRFIAQWKDIIENI